MSENPNDIAKLQRVARLQDEAIKSLEEAIKNLREQQIQDQAKLAGALDVISELIATCLPLTTAQVRARISRETARHLADPAQHGAQAPVLTGAYAARN